MNMITKTQTIGVAGLGLLGRGIAACCLAHGFRVVAFTRSERALREARHYIDSAIGDLVDRAGFPQELETGWVDRFEGVHSFGSFSKCSFVIESVLEDLDAKSKVFDEVESVIGPNVPIASNTSSIPISQLQDGRANPERFVGMHWAEPAHATRFLELIRGEQTSETAFQAAADLAKQFGKDPCLVQKDVPAFIVNRLSYAMYREAAHLVETGVADVETIDRSCRNALGLWAAMCGPFRWMDITGGPALYGASVERVLPSLNNEAKTLPAFFEKLKREGARGTIDGHGFYEYGEADREKWDTLFREHSWRVKQWLDAQFPLKPEPRASSEHE